MNKMSLIIRSTNEDILVINSSLSLLNPRNILTEQRKFGGHFFTNLLLLKNSSTRGHFVMRIRASRGSRQVRITLIKIKIKIKM